MGYTRIHRHRVASRSQSAFRNQFNIPHIRKFSKIFYRSTNSPFRMGCGPDRTTELDSIANKYSDTSRCYDFIANSGWRTTGTLKLIMCCVWPNGWGWGRGCCGLEIEVLANVVEIEEKGGERARFGLAWLGWEAMKDAAEMVTAMLGGAFSMDGGGEGGGVNESTALSQPCRLIYPSIIWYICVVIRLHRPTRGQPVHRLAFRHYEYADQMVSSVHHHCLYALQHKHTSSSWWERGSAAATVSFIDRLPDLPPAPICHINFNRSPAAIAPKN